MVVGKLRKTITLVIINWPPKVGLKNQLRRSVF